MTDKCETPSDIITRITKEYGVNPNNMEFRAKLTATLLAAGYFSGTGKQLKENKPS